MFDLKGQVAVVTGASSGLGKQMARGFARQGANLAILARSLCSAPRSTGLSSVS